MKLPVSCAASSNENGNLIVTVLEQQIRDATTAYRLRDEMIALLDEYGPTNLVLNLANLEFIGSVGFLAFLSVRRHLAGGRIVLCNVSDTVRDTFAVCRLIVTETQASAPFELATTPSAALAHLAA